MNILLTSQRFFPDIGGIESIAEILARNFVSSGHAVTLITKSSADTLSDQQFPFQVLRRPSAWQMRSTFNWADVVLQNNLEIRQLWPMLCLNRPLVIALHTWIRTATGERGTLQQMKMGLLGVASRVIAVSNAIRIDSFPNAEVIGNPYNSSSFRVVSGIPRRQAIVFLGRLVSDKGLDLLLRSYAALQRPDWPLTVIGSGPEHQALQALACTLGLASCVRFVGPLQGEALVLELNAHELMVVPSLWREPFGVVVLEGQACGCVVLASDGGGLPDAVGSAGLLFRRGDQADLMANLRLLIEDGELRARLRGEASKHLAHFREDVVSAQYLEILKSVHREFHP